VQHSIGLCTSSEIVNQKKKKTPNQKTQKKNKTKTKKKKKKKTEGGGGWGEGGGVTNQPGFMVIKENREITKAPSSYTSNHSALNGAKKLWEQREKDESGFEN